jgi:hypothetical protein
VTALASSLKRLWSAKNRVPRLTGWGTPGSSPHSIETITPIGCVMEKFLALLALARRTAPTIVVITLNIFR